MITQQLTVTDLDGEHQNLTFFLIYYPHYLSCGGGWGCSSWSLCSNICCLTFSPPPPYLPSGGSSHLCRCLLWGPLSSRLKLLTLQKKKKKSKALLKLLQTPGDLLHQLTRRRRSHLQDTFQSFYLSVAQTSSLPPPTLYKRTSLWRPTLSSQLAPLSTPASLPVSVSGYRFN